MNLFKLLLLAAAGIAIAEPAANLNFTSEFAETHGCGANCQNLLHRVMDQDRHEFGRDYDFDFYETAHNFSRSQPGDLLKLQALDPSTLSVGPGTSVWRFQYTSVDLDDKTPVPATGFIAFPYRPLTGSRFKSDKTRYRTVAFAHGTTGLYAGCAPSSSPDLYDYGSWRMLVDRGYVVVATDYAGLGNNRTLHKYCSFPAQANDVYYSVLAARQAFGRALSFAWMSVGHSQGGGVVWSLAENRRGSQYDRWPKVPRIQNEYLGTVAIAPATFVVDMAVASFDPAGNGFKDSGVQDDGGMLALMPFLAVAVERVYPDYKMELLANKIRQRMAIAEKAQMCAIGFWGLSADLSMDGIVNLEGAGSSLPVLKHWQTQMAPARRSMQAPMLVIQGLNDSIILPSSTWAAVKKACYDHEALIHLSEYPGLQHSPVVAASAPEWLAWIDAAFDGGKVLANRRCTKTVVRPSAAEDRMKLPPEIDLEVLLG